MTKNQSEAAKLRWKNPEYRRKIRQRFRERNIRLWQDPEYRRKMIQERKQRWEDPQYREKQSQASRETWKRDEVKQKQSKALKKYWADPQNKQKRTELMRTICRTPEFRKKISEISTKLWQDPEFRRKTCVALKKISNDPQRLRKMSKAMKKKWQNAEYRKKMVEMWNDPEFRANHTGEKCRAWRGGISFEPYSSKFNNYRKKQIKNRDNHICQFPGCESTQKLIVHHIDYNKRNCASTNLITLCRSCNGKVNANRSYWTAYFTQKVLAINPNNFENNLLILDHYFNYSEKTCQEVTNMG